MKSSFEQCTRRYPTQGEGAAFNWRTIDDLDAAYDAALHMWLMIHILTNGDRTAQDAASAKALDLIRDGDLLNVRHVQTTIF